LTNKKEEKKRKKKRGRLSDVQKVITHLRLVYSSAGFWLPGGFASEKTAEIQLERELCQKKLPALLRLKSSLGFGSHSFS